jgi:hypothetical protein
MKKLTESELLQAAKIKAAIKASGRSQAFIGRVVYADIPISDQDKKNRINRICNGKLRPSQRFWAVLNLFGIHVKKRYSNGLQGNTRRKG